MGETPTDPLAEVAEYFGRTLEEFGPTPRGVDWNSEQRQRLSFEQLAKLFTSPGGFSVHDLGCGYGAFCDFLDERYPGVHYLGYDVSPEMVRAAEGAHQGRPNTRFHVASRPLVEATYGIACGIFNVKVECDDDAWRRHVYQTLDVLHESSREGFAFNCLTTYSDPHLLKPRLFYADPGEVFDHCKRRYSRNVALLHDYDAYEFTVLVRKRLP
jgi:SAM-dependent methyltransferase